MLLQIECRSSNVTHELKHVTGEEKARGGVKKGVDGCSNRAGERIVILNVTTASDCRHLCHLLRSVGEKQADL